MHLRILTLFTLILFVVSCSSDDNQNHIDQYSIKMFPEMNKIGSTTNQNNDSYYLRYNTDNFLIEFIKIDQNGNSNVRDITNDMSNISNGQFLREFTLYDYNGTIIAVTEEFISLSQKNIIYIVFDYEGNIISSQILETITTVNDGIHVYINLHPTGFYTYYTLLNQNVFNLKSYNFNGMLTNNIDIQRDQLIMDIQGSIDEVFYENNRFYIVGENPSRQFCFSYDNLGSLINSKEWNENINNAWSIDIRFTQDKIIRYYFSDNGNGIFEFYNSEGVLLDSTTVNNVRHFHLSSLGNLLYVSYNGADEKNLDLKVLNSNLQEIYSRNFGGNNMADDGGTTSISAIHETPGIYSVFGFTSRTKNGDFNLPENTPGFDEFMGIFIKN